MWNFNGLLNGYQTQDFFQMLGIFATAVKIASFKNKNNATF